MYKAKGGGNNHPKGKIMENRKIYTIKNTECNERCEIVLTKKEYDIIMRYCNIINELWTTPISPPLEKC
jgi:hypothetical protein